MEKIDENTNKKSKEKKNELFNENMVSLIGESYTSIGKDLLSSHEKEFKMLINCRECPEIGLKQETIKYILNVLSLMDSNNGPNHVGIGEREGRIKSQIVKDRHFSMIHGIGRSGSINDLQPKAAGSSLLSKLSKALLKNFLISIGMTYIKEVIIFPVATGMALTLCYLTLKQNNKNAKYIIFPRIDQKTCLKAIITSGLTPLVVEPIRKDDLLCTNLEEIKQLVDKFKDEILCISSTTSCFAPRSFDSIQEISVICKESKIKHIVNNAYGIYCSKLNEEIMQSIKIGEITAIVSSTDKNLMVPVGGSFIYSNEKIIIDELASNYPGRASMTPIMDVFITLLEIGKKQYKQMMKLRQDLFDKCFDDFKDLAKKFGERMLETKKGNRISMAMSLGNICKNLNQKEISFLGSMFFSRQISGIKVVLKTENDYEISGLRFKNYNSHSNDDVNLPFIVFAVAIGITYEEIEEFKVKFEKILSEFVIKINTKENN